MRGAIAAKLFGVGRQLIDVDDRRVIVGTIITIQPGENERDFVLGRGLELLAGPGGQVDFTRLRRRAAAQKSMAAVSAAADFATRVKILFLKVQIRSLNDVPELDDVLLDRLPEIGGRTAAGRDREIAQFE